VLAVHVYTLWVFARYQYRDDRKVLPALYTLDIILVTFLAPHVLANHHVPTL